MSALTIADPSLHIRPVSSADPPLPINRDQQTLLKSAPSNLYIVHLQSREPEFLLSVINKAYRFALSLSYLESLPDQVIVETDNESELAQLFQNSISLPRPLVSDFCNMVTIARFRPGMIVRWKNVDFPEDAAQVVSVDAARMKVTIRLFPRVDYNEMMAREVFSQKKINQMMDPSYRAPVDAFRRAFLYRSGAKFDKKNMRIGETIVPMVVWDGDCFAEPFMYKEGVPIDTIVTGVKLTSDEFDRFGAALQRVPFAFDDGFIRRAERAFPGAKTGLQSSGDEEIEEEGSPDGGVKSEPPFDPPFVMVSASSPESPEPALEPPPSPVLGSLALADGPLAPSSIVSLQPNILLRVVDSDNRNLFCTLNRADIVGLRNSFRHLTPTEFASACTRPAFRRSDSSILCDAGTLVDGFEMVRQRQKRPPPPPPSPWTSSQTDPLPPPNFRVHDLVILLSGARGVVLSVGITFRVRTLTGDVVVSEGEITGRVQQWAFQVDRFHVRIFLGDSLRFRGSLYRCIAQMPESVFLVSGDTKLWAPLTDVEVAASGNPTSLVGGTVHKLLRRSDGSQRVDSESYVITEVSNHGMIRVKNPRIGEDKFKFVDHGRFWVFSNLNERNE
jgi:hypothetical protein